MNCPSDSLQVRSKIGENMTKEKKKSPILLIIFAIIIPLMLTVGIVYIGLTLVGIDVKDKLADVPVVSSFIKSNEVEQLEETIKKQEDLIASKDEEINDLSKDVKSLRAIADDLELDLKKKEKSEQKNEKENIEDEEDGNEALKRAASSYRKMEPENAAAIITQMNDQDAIQILSNIPSDVRGNILAEMESKRAATLTKLMMKELPIYNLEGGEWNGNYASIHTNKCEYAAK